VKARARAVSLRAAVVLALALAAPAHPDTAAEIASELGLSADERARLERGEVVTRDPQTSNERELAVGLAIRIRRAPAELARELLDGLALRQDPNVLAHGPISTGAIQEFAGVGLESADAARGYLEARPGEALNLSADEIAAFQALARDPGATSDPRARVEPVLRQQLQARYRAYAEAGLAGMAAYARGGSREERPGDDLLAATRASRFFEKHAPGMFAVLTGYPRTPPAALQERYQWLVDNAHGERVLVLGHFLALPDGDAWSVCARHFYVSKTYNAEQNLALLVPTQDGTTLALLLGRVSTDQVAGFGGGAKRSIGRRLMEQTLTALAERIRKAAG
jgi:hypothetical protein